MADNSFSQFDINYTPKPFDFTQATNDFNSYLGNYKNAIESMPSASSIYGKYAQALGIPDMQEGVNRYRQLTGDLQSRLFAVPETVGQTTRESLVTEGQRQRMVNSQSEPLTRDLARLAPAQASLEQTLREAQSGAQQLTGMDVTQQERNLLPFEKEYDFNTRKLAMEVTGWSEAQKMELDKLIANQQAGLTWTNAEKDRANQLAIAEMGYKNALEQISARGEQDRLTKKAPSDLATLYRSIYG